MKVLAHFRPVKKDRENKLNSREGKLRFAFKMYDTDNDDLISKEELLGVLQMMVGDNISEDQLISIAERTIVEADKDGDQMISFQEFCNALERTDVEQKMSIRFLNWIFISSPLFVFTLYTFIQTLFFIFFSNSFLGLECFGFQIRR